MHGDPARKYVLLVTLVLAAFVTASTVHALPKTLEKVDWKAPCFRWPAQDYDGDGVADRLDRGNNTPKGCLVDAYGCSLDADGDGVCDGIDQCPDTPRGEKVDSVGCSAAQRMGRREGRDASTVPAPEPPKATVPAPAPAPTPSAPASEVERQLVSGGVVRLENIYFETNSAKLLPASETTLNQAGDALEKFVDLKVEIQGHTDTRGSAVYNRRLSQARAESVRRYLLAKFHLRTENLVAKGYGKSQPETAERTDADRQRNRRVVLKVLNPDALPKNVQIEHK